MFTGCQMAQNMSVIIGLNPLRSLSFSPEYQRKKKKKIGKDKELQKGVESKIRNKDWRRLDSVLGRMSIWYSAQICKF